MKKKVLIVGAVATAAILAGGWALAQSGGVGPGGMGPGMMQHMGQGMGPGMGKGMMGHMGGGMGPGMMHGGAGPTPFDPARLETLKTELGITAAQEPAWTKYAKAVQGAAATMKTTREGVNPDTVSKMTPQDRFAFVTKISGASAEAIRGGEDWCRGAARHARRRAEGQGPADPPWARVRPGHEAYNGHGRPAAPALMPVMPPLAARHLSTLDASKVQRGLPRLVLNRSHS